MIRLWKARIGMRFPQPSQLRHQVSHISEANSGLDAMGMVRDLLEGHQKIIDLLTQVSEEAENQKSKGTINLVDDLNEAHGKFIWMLRSFVL